MKLGKALTIRRRQAEKLNDLRGRIKANAVTQEGDQPAESAYDLIKEYGALSAEHADLVRRINRTNIETVTTFPMTSSSFPPGDRPLLDLISEREHLNRIRNILVIGADAAAPSRNDFRYLRSEIKFVPTMDVSELRHRIDEAQSAINELDMQIQEINWRTEVVS